MDSNSEWVSEANKAVTLSVGKHKFHPEFTYPFYGEDEVIYGFKGLRIDVKFSPRKLKPLIKVVYDQKRPTSDVVSQVVRPLLERMFEGEIKPLSKEGSLWTSSDEQFEHWMQEENSFLAPGQKLCAFQTSTGQTYDLHLCSFSDSQFKQLHRYMQILLLFTIEGASFIDEDDRWQIYVLWERKEQNYHFAGYWTVYPFYLFPDKLRMRISQVLILPPFQGQGLGTKIYNLLMDKFVSDPQVTDVTVEDPTETFQDLRTRNDLRRLIKNGVKVNAKTSIEKFEALRLQYRLAKSHATEVFELLALQQLDMNNNIELQSYRRWIKKRLYRKNYEALKEINADGVKLKLAETYEALIEGYNDLLESLQG